MATFTDDKGNPVPFIIKQLSMKEIKEIRNLYKTTEVFRDKKNGNRPVIENGQVAVRKDYDAERAGLHIMVDAFVQPKLDDPELMEFYKVKQDSKLDMTFASFYEIYAEDKKARLKESTWESKSHVIEKKILPYFGKRKIADIEAKDVIAWQNELMKYRDEKGKPYSGDYLKTIHAQLTAIFNHAVNFYNLPYNPAKRAGCMKVQTSKEVEFWTKEEYLKFAEVMMDKPRSYYAFEMLYWTGIRSGELLALCPSDFDFEKQTVKISKTYHRSKGRDIITTPKTAKSNRTIKMPKFLCEEIQEYMKMLYEVKPDDRIFTVTKSYLDHEMRRGVKEAGLKKIKVHALRHSHVSLLIHMGFTVLAIAERMGHEAEKITLKYAHLFPTVQTEMAEKLDMERMKKEDE